MTDPLGPVEAWTDVSARVARATGVRSIRRDHTRSPAAAASAGVLTLAAIVVGAALLVRPAGVGPVAGGPVTATADDGMFRLTLATPRSTYTTADDIGPVASLAYLGPDPVRTIYHAVHPMSFRIEEIGGRRTMDGGTDLPCNHTLLQKDRPIDQPFAKSGSPTENPLQGFDAAWYEDPVLRLPAGHWRVIVELAISVDGCGGPRHDLAVSNEITVTPFVARSDAVVASAEDAMFRLDLKTPHGVYEADEPIEAVATVTYLGPAAEETIFHSSPVLFYLDEIGGTRKMSGTMGGACGSSVIRKDAPQVYPFQKSGAIDDAFERSWWDDPILRLPAGTWRIRVALLVATGGSDPCAGVSHNLTVDNFVRVDTPDPSPAFPSPVASGSFAAPPSEPLRSAAAPSEALRSAAAPSVDPSFSAGEPVVDSVDDGIFELELRTPFGRYGPEDSIEPIARLRYTGSGDSVRFGHGAPPVVFSVEEIGGDRRMTGVVADSCSSTTIRKGDVMTFRFKKSGQIDVGFDEAWFHEPVLKLPPGTWRISAQLGAYVSECGLDAEIHQPVVVNVVTVVARS